MSEQNRQIHLVARPQGPVTEDCFRVVDAPVPAAPEGGIVVRQHYLSLDPYMRGRLDDVKSYAPPQPLNEVMIGGSVGEVVESKSPDYAVGDAVVGMGGWQLYAAGTAAQWRKVDRRVPFISLNCMPVICVK